MLLQTSYKRQLAHQFLMYYYWLVFCPLPFCCLCGIAELAKSTDMWIHLLKTWLVEIPILWLFLRRNDHLTSIVGLGALINVSTWTFLVYYYYQFGGNIYFLELLVALVESLWIRSLWSINWPKSVLIGLVANAVSFGLGWSGIL
ncbi:hypothetical protein DR864_17675 [Runella rosea]|uniref:Uncharacterized protein n=2 Tax=Runella rosea TaxID=2259595 RepID=A0A344TLC1_9BACT|nr:hypothetical protein DR864_17675 [Runella rosea]